MRIGVFLHLSPWGDIDQDAMSKGLGGRETALVQLALAWSYQGHDVFAFVPREEIRKMRQFGEGSVTWIPMKNVLTIAPVLELDMFVSWENVSVLDQLKDVDVGVRVIEMQVAHLVNEGLDLNEITDYVACLSDWAGDFFHHEHSGFARDKIVTLPNGVDLKRFENVNGAAELDGMNFIYSSSPDRGLHHLLTMWPAIQEMIWDEYEQHSTLHVCYGVETFVGGSRWSHKSDAERALIVERGLKLDGVKYHGKVGQDVVAELMLGCDALLYPCDTMSYTETGCITIVEALAADLPVVTTDCDCLGSEFRDVAYMVDLPLDYEEYISMVRTACWEMPPAGIKEFVQKRNWSYIAAQWEFRFENEIKSRRDVKDAQVA